jgi:hypothetical protein
MGPAQPAGWRVLHVIEQGIDASTTEGRAMLGLLSVLARPQRELIVANTNDGLAPARARGRSGGVPAPAGVARRRPQARRDGDRRPRARGGYSGQSAPLTVQTVSSPRLSGAAGGPVTGSTEAGSDRRTCSAGRPTTRETG